MLLGMTAGATWLAYAAFAWNVGRRLKTADRNNLPAGDISSELTVLIPCRNEAEALHHLLNDLKSQSHPVRILVIDDASTDGTRRAAPQRRLASPASLRRVRAKNPPWRRASSK